MVGIRYELIQGFLQPTLLDDNLQWMITQHQSVMAVVHVGLGIDY